MEQTVSGAPRESETSCFENESNYVNELFNFQQISDVPTPNKSLWFVP